MSAAYNIRSNVDYRRAAEVPAPQALSGVYSLTEAGEAALARVEWDEGVERLVAEAMVERCDGCRHVRVWHDEDAGPCRYSRCKCRLYARPQVEPASVPA